MLTALDMSELETKRTCIHFGGATDNAQTKTKQNYNDQTNQPTNQTKIGSPQQQQHIVVLWVQSTTAATKRKKNKTCRARANQTNETNETNETNKQTNKQTNNKKNRRKKKKEEKKKPASANKHKA